MAHPYADSLYTALFDVDSEDELEQSLLDWSQFTAVERSFASAQINWLLAERFRDLTDAVRALHGLAEDVATRPDRPPDILDAEVIDG